MLNTIHTWAGFISENQRIFESLSDNWVIKIIMGLMAGLLATPDQLVALITLLVLIDLITGIMRSLAEGRPITAHNLWGTGLKVLQYSAFLAVTTAVANSFAALYLLQEGSYMFVALTELKSIIENIFGSKEKGQKVWAEVKNIMTRQISIDEPENNQKRTDNEK